jgi:hypothetical protein
MPGAGFVVRELSRPTFGVPWYGHIHANREHDKAYFGAARGATRPRRSVYFFQRSSRFDAVRSCSVATSPLG